MIHYILCLILVLITALGYSQTEPIDSPASLPKVEISIGKPIAFINNAVGFAFTKSKKWTSAKMKIPFADDEKNSTLYDGYDIGADNINRFDIRPINIDGKLYYLLLIGVNKIKRKEKNYDEFELDKLYRYEEVEFFVFTKDELKKLNLPTTKSNDIVNINLEFTYAGMFGMNKKLNLEKQIKNYVTDRVLDSTIDLDSTISYFQMVFIPTLIGGVKYLKFNRYYAYATKGTEPESFGNDDFRFQYFRISEADYRRFVANIK